MSETKSTMIPVREWDERVGVSLGLVARRWGLTEDETLELFGLIPTIGHDEDGRGGFSVADTGERLWVAAHILFAEGDMPDLATGQGRAVLEGLRTLKSAVEGIEPDMYLELMHGVGMAGEQMSADRLRSLAGMDTDALRAEIERYTVA